MVRLPAVALEMLGSGISPGRASLRVNRLRRLPVTLLLALLLPLALAWYWLGLGLDELLFRRYRRVSVRAPVFILGVPRSGTTALHAALAHDPQFTTQRTWECLLAPAITHRYLFRGLARLDRRLGAPLQRLAGALNRRWIAPLAGAHPLAAHAPEEDYLALLAHLSAFILVLAFPDSSWLWRLGRGDQALAPAERERLMAQYRRAIQRHLYFHGQRRAAAGHPTYLAKNASFATLAGSLLDAFPDARIIACLRAPEGAVSSQLSSIEPALAALHGRIDRIELARRMQRQLGFAYRNLLDVLPRRAPAQSVFVPLGAQKRDLAGTIQATYTVLGLPLAPAFSAHLDTLSEQARSHRSGHRHQPEDYGLSAAGLRTAFADVHTAFEFDAETPIMAASLPALPPGRRVAVISDAAPERNGVGTYYSDLVAHLSDRLGQIMLIAAGSEATALPHWYEFRLPGDATQRMGLPSPRALRAALEDLAPQVVIIATPGPYGLLAARTANALGARVIFGLHTDYEALAGLYWGRVRGTLQRFGMAWVNRTLFRRADVVVSNSAHMHRLAERMGARQAVRVNTPIPRSFIDTPVTAPPVPPRRVLFVGRLASEKRVEQIIQAARSHPGLQFRIAGDGPLRECVESAAGELGNLDYLGWVDRARIIDILDATDILTLPSRVEAFGTVALEALARGRITLVSPGCGIADWAEFAPGLEVMRQDETVSTALERLLATPDAVLARTAQTGRDAACQMAEHCIDEWLELVNPDPERQQ